MVKYIDASDLILGRMASYAAKQALLGEQVIIVNCEKAVVSGSAAIVKQHKFKRHGGIGRPFHGPYFSRYSDALVRRTVRGMLPFATTRGREAYRRVKCYIGVPENFQNQKFETVRAASSERLASPKHLTIKQVSGMISKHGD